MRSSANIWTGGSDRAGRAGGERLRPHGSRGHGNPRLRVSVSSRWGCPPPPRLRRIRRSSQSIAGERRLEGPGTSARESGGEGTRGGQGRRDAQRQDEEINLTIAEIALNDRKEECEEQREEDPQRIR